MSYLPCHTCHRYYIYIYHVRHPLVAYLSILSSSLSSPSYPILISPSLLTFCLFLPLFFLHILLIASLALLGLVGGQHDLPNQERNHPLRNRPPSQSNDNNPPNRRHQRPRKNIKQKRIKDDIHVYLGWVHHQAGVGGEVIGRGGDLEEEETGSGLRVSSPS